MANYYDKAVPLSGWDVAYGIRFEELNQVMNSLNATPVALSGGAVSLLRSGQNVLRTVGGTYTSWQAIGSESGRKIGVLIKIKNLTYAECDAVPAPADAPQVYFNKTNDRFVAAGAARNTLSFAHEVGLVVALPLTWQEAGPGSGKFALMAGKDPGGINFGDFIAHPDDPTEDDDPLFIYGQTLLKNAIAKAVVEEFDHAFARLDYTQQAQYNASWLKLTSHDSAVSQVARPAADGDGSSPATPVQQYEQALRVAGYPAGILMIVGMTGNRRAPLSIPSVLETLIPANCAAGYAYSEQLIIPNLIAGHLSELFACDLANDFQYGYNQTALSNKNRITLKNKVKLDLINGFSGHPEVAGTIYPDGIKISVSNGRIIYNLQVVYEVPKGVLGFGLPYDVQVKQEYALIFDYVIKRSDQAPYHPYATVELTNNPPPVTTAELSPKPEEHSAGFSWNTLKDFGLALAENVVIMGLTMGFMYVGSAFASGVVRGGRSIARTVVKSEPGAQAAEVAVLEGAETLGTSRVLQNLETELAQLEKSGVMLSKEGETALQLSKREGVMTYSQSGKSMIWELVKFTFWQTLVTKGLQMYQNYELSSLTTQARSQAFLTFVESAITVVDWGNRADGSSFEVQEGGLTSGAFLIGLQFTKDQ